VATDLALLVLYVRMERQARGATSRVTPAPA
jgi:hypothetical protein